MMVAAVFAGGDDPLWALWLFDWRGHMPDLAWKTFHNTGYAATGDVARATASGR